MSTKSVRGSVSSSKKKEGLNAMVFAVLAANCDLHLYGAGNPLYELVQNFGSVVPLNTLDSALQSYDEIKDGLNPGDAAFTYSEEYKRFSLAMKMPQGGIAFSGLIHDHNGTPIVDEPLQICLVKAVKDFELNGEVIISKGEEFIKAVPKSYVNRMKKAA